MNKLTKIKFGQRTVMAILLFFVSGVCAFAQNVTVSGIVTDRLTKEPLIGASVVVKGTTIGTVTDLDGRYSLSTPPRATLVFTYIGFESQEVSVTGENLNVSMRSSDVTIDEVTIVGTVMKKSDLTGAVGSVSGEVLQEMPVTSINQALQGRAAGVLISAAAKPGDDSSIKIRGINTIDGETDPIYVVDGLVMDNYGGGFNSINLNDVASIEVLKDASATALYGSRAANGVVLITTKKGSKGEGKVSYDGWVGVRSYAKRPKTMNSKQLFELRRDAAMNSFMARHPDATQAEIDANLRDRIMTAYDPVNNTGGYVFGQYELDAYNNPNFQDSDWLSEVTRDAIEHNHLLSFAGGSDNGTYYLSFGFADQQGMVKNLGNQNISGRVNIDYNVKPWLKIGTNTSYVHTESQIAENDDVFDKARGANPMLPVDYNLLTLNYGDRVDENYFSPLGTMRIENDRVRNRIISSNFLNINPMKGLNFRTTFALNHFEESTFRYQPNDIQQAIRYSNHGETEHKRDNVTMWQWDNTISYDNTFGVHRINVLLGTSASQNSRNYTNATGRNFDTNYFGYHNIGASQSTADRLVESDFYSSSLMSYYARANYTYADKYYLTITARYDGSSKFAKDYRWGLFPSFSGAWNVTQEDFMQDQSIFDQLKLRVGYGIVGNQEIDNYAFLTLYKPNVSGGSTTYVPDSKQGTKDISWEGQRQFNVGLDMVFVNNKIRLSADYFDITNTDLLMTKNVAETSGFETAVVNVGEIQNRGVELSLDVNALRTRDLEWNIFANFSKDRNKVTKLYDDFTYIKKYNDDHNLEKEGNLFIGESRNTIYIWKTGGIAQASDMERLNQMDWRGKNVGPGDLYPQDVSGPDGVPDGVIDDEYDRVIVGSPDPKFYGGFSTDLTYKGLTLNMVFNYSYGAKKLSPLYETMVGSTGSSLASVDLLDRWTPENTSAKFPRPMYQDGNDAAGSYNPFSINQMDLSVQDASYLRLSTLTLAYVFPQKIVRTLRLDTLRVYGTASNVFCWTPYEGYDPEMGDWYPPTRMFVFGLNVSF